MVRNGPASTRVRSSTRRPASEPDPLGGSGFGHRRLVLAMVAAGIARRRGGGKKVKGRKRHIVTDTGGLLVAAPTMIAIFYRRRLLWERDIPVTSSFE